MNEASARIKIDKLLESASWRFFADGNRPANVQLVPRVGVTSTQLEELGNDFEKTEKGFVDFLLHNEEGFPLIWKQQIQFEKSLFTVITCLKETLKSVWRTTRARI